MEDRPCRVLRDQGLFKAARDRDRKAWFADSQFSSVRGHLARVGRALPVSDRLTKIVPANSAVVHIQPAHRVPADIRRVPAWAEVLVPEARRHLQVDLHVRADQRVVPASLLFRGKKKAR